VGPRRLGPTYTKKRTCHVQVHARPSRTSPRPKGPKGTRPHHAPSGRGVVVSDKKRAKTLEFLSRPLSRRPTEPAAGRLPIRTTFQRYPMANTLHESRSARFAMRCSAWAERWFPDSWVFAAVAVLLVTVAALGIGAPASQAAKAFGDGFWSLIPFTMQMAFVVIGGYVVASSGPASRLIDLLARVPK